VDGRRKAAQLEVHEVRLVVLLALLPAVAGAQVRGRVYVSGANGEAGAVFEFRPCIPAEGSDCGAWVDHAVDSIAVAPLRAARSGDGRDSLWIADGALMIRSISDARQTVVRDRRGPPTAIVASPTARVAFVVLDGKSLAPNYIVMIDLETRSAIASAPFRFTPGGIGVVR
jgi:hypothetical protein